MQTKVKESKRFWNIFIAKKKRKRKKILTSLFNPLAALKTFQICPKKLRPICGEALSNLKNLTLSEYFLQHYNLRLKVM